MKKLLICSPSNSLVGGVETIVNDLCRELPKRGWETVLGLGKGTRFNKVESYQAAYPDLPILEIDGTKGTRQARIEALMAVIEKFRPDIVLSARIFDAYEAINHCKKRHPKLRFAVTIQVYEPQYLYDLRKNLECVDLCITSGNLLKLAAVKWAGLPFNRVVSVPGGVSMPTLKPVPRRPRSPLRLGYVGRIEQSQKRVLDAESFVRHLDNQQLEYTFDIVGTGEASSELQHRLGPWVRRGRVTFHGWKSKEQLYLDIFPNLDCLIHFAHSEGVTIAPREAMAHGVVPVISRFIGLEAENHFVHELNCLTFPVGDCEFAARNVGLLVREPGLLERLSRNAISSQLGEYTFEGSMDAWAAAFERCLKQPVTIPQFATAHAIDGRLARIGFSPYIAQRVRDVLGRTHVHDDPGSEWPTGSGSITTAAADEIMRFGTDFRTIDATVVSAY